MLKDVRIHLDTDEKRQNAREREVAALIMQNVRRNEATFKAYVPSLVKVVKQAQSQHISVFINRFGNINIVRNSFRANWDWECSSLYAINNRKNILIILFYLNN